MDRPRRQCAGISLHRCIRRDCSRCGLAEYKVKRRLLLDIIVGERAAVLEIPVHQALPFRWDAILVLDLVSASVDESLDPVNMLIQKVPRRRWDRKVRYQCFNRRSWIASEIRETYLTFQIESEDWTSRVMVLPVSVLT